MLVFLFLPLVYGTKLNDLYTLWNQSCLKHVWMQRHWQQNKIVPTHQYCRVKLHLVISLNSNLLIWVYFCVHDKVLSLQDILLVSQNKDEAPTLFSISKSSILLISVLMFSMLLLFFPFKVFLFLYHFIYRIQYFQQIFWEDRKSAMPQNCFLFLDSSVFQDW